MNVNMPFFTLVTQPQPQHSSDTPQSRGEHSLSQHLLPLCSPSTTRLWVIAAPAALKLSPNRRPQEKGCQVCVAPGPDSAPAPAVPPRSRSWSVVYAAIRNPLKQTTVYLALGRKSLETEEFQNNKHPTHIYLAEKLFCPPRVLQSRPHISGNFIQPVLLRAASLWESVYSGPYPSSHS